MTDELLIVASFLAGYGTSTRNGQRRRAPVGVEFLNDHSNDAVPWPIEVLAWVSSTSYHEPSASDARHCVIDFFPTHLVHPPAPPRATGPSHRWVLSVVQWRSPTGCTFSPSAPDR